MIDTAKVTLKTGNEIFLKNGKNSDITLSDFWKWSSSDLLNNALRGVLSEFIVGKALDCNREYRTEWDAYDLETPEGLTIEVKSAAYLQSWQQEKLSTISFGIAPTFGWNARTNEYSDEKKRQAMIYVFCLLKEPSPDKINPINLDQWEFYVLATKVLDKKVGNQKSIRLQPLINLGAKSSSFRFLKKSIFDIAGEFGLLRT